MDQNSSNSATGKSNWREKLGIGTGTKELPKISDEFKPAGAAPSPPKPPRVEPKIVAKPAPRAPHVIAKPAPMAPRPAQTAPARPAPPPAPVPEAKSESLAERLKSQRQAAERLAEQRIGVVRDTVRDTRESKPAPAREAEQVKSKALATPPTEAPKFTFAQEELSSAKVDLTSESSRKYVPAYQPATPPSSPVVPPLVPPRPALGGDKPVIPPVRQEPVGYGGTAGAPPSGYRPLDPPPHQPQRPLTPIVPAQPNYGEPVGMDPRQLPATGRREAFDSTRRAAPPTRIGAEAGEPMLPADDMQRGRRPQQQLQRPKRPVSYEDDLGEVFENEEAAPPPRRRARAQDYSQAYREYEDNYEEDERRSSGPWLLLLALLVLAALAFGGIWYYSKYMTPQQGAQQTGDVAPVVPAPKEQSKTLTQPEPDTANAAINSQEPAPAVKKKLIYDRILGDQAIEGGKLVPTEEAPAQAAPTQNQQTAPAADQGGLDSGGATQPPQPIAPTDPQALDPGGAGQSEPLPVPPTPGSTQPQGSLTPNNGQQVASATVSPASTMTSDPAASEPSSDTIPENAALQPDTQAEQPVDPSRAAEEPTPPAKPKARVTEAPAKPKKKVKTAAQKRPKPEPAIRSSSSSRSLEPQPSPEQTQAVSGSGSFFGDGSQVASRSTAKQADKILSAGRTNFSSKPSDRTVAADTQQVASIDPIEPQTTSKTAERSAAPGNGYVAQLASFRSQAEALSEFDRLKSKHNGILGGMSPRVSKGTVGGTTRYRLGVGPMASRDEASKVCSSLIASGERDCIVKQQ